MKIDFRTKETRLIRFYLIISALMILNLCLFVSARMSFAGYWSDRILFWIWVFTTPFIIILCWMKLFTKIYFGLLMITLILSFLPMAVPFFAIFLSASGEGRINHFNLDNNMRIQIVNYGILGRPRVQVVKDNFLFDQIKYEDQDEIQKNDSTWFELRDAKNVILINETANSITVKYFFENDTLNTTHQFQ